MFQFTGLQQRALSMARGNTPLKVVSPPTIGSQWWSRGESPAPKT